MPDLDEAPLRLVNSLLRLDYNGVRELLANIPAPDRDAGFRSLEAIMLPALEHIGKAWEEGRLALSQVYLAGKMCERAVEETFPVAHTLRNGNCRLAIGVMGDHHALGKRMVKSALHSAGYTLLDYGHGLQASELVEMTIRDQVKVLLISCLMLSSAVMVEDVVTGLRRVGSPAMVVVGGAPFRLDLQLWKEVGARAMGRNSVEAVRIVQTLQGDRV